MDMTKLGDLVRAAASVSGVPDKTVKEKARLIRQAGFIQTGSVGRYGGADMTEGDASNLLLAISCTPYVADAPEIVLLYRHLFGLTKEHMTAPGQSLPVPDKPGWFKTEPRESLCPEPLRWLGQAAQGQTLGDALYRLIGMAHTGELQNLFRDLAGKHVGAQGADRDAVIDMAIRDLGVVFLKLEFRRPRPGAVIVFGEAGAGPRPSRGPYLEVEFGHSSALETPEEMDSRKIGDRLETVTITHRTIFALGEALRS
jgi:hypothetical protein